MNVHFKDNWTIGMLPDGRWRAHSATFNVSTYGQTEDDAKAKNDAAVEGIVRAMASRGGVVRLRNRFRLANVNYHITQPNAASYFSEERELDLGVVGAG